MPKISVIIPTYNRSQFIEDAIESVLHQTFSDWELIVVDDGSTDNTASVVAQHSDRVTYLYQPNQGACTARNTGLAASRGEWVSFLDSDDRMLPNNLESLITLIRTKPRVDVVYGWYFFMDEKGQPAPWRGGPRIRGAPPVSFGPGIELWPCGTRREGDILPQLVLEEAMFMGTSLIRRSCATAIGGFDPDLRFQEHWDFYLRLAHSGCRFACCKQPVLFVRLHSENRGQALQEMLSSRIAVLDRLFGAPHSNAKLSRVRPRAYYNAFMEHAFLYFAQFDSIRGMRCINDALQFARLSRADQDFLAGRIANQAISNALHSPFRFVDKIFESTPLNVQTRLLRQRILGRVHGKIALEQYQKGELTIQAWRHALLALRQNRPFRRNRLLILEIGRRFLRRCFERLRKGGAGCGRGDT